MSSIPEPSDHDFADWILFGNFYYESRDIIGFGWEMTLENVRDAYRKGVFPWHIEGMPLPWFCPEKRAVLDFKNLHVSRSLQKERRRTNYEYAVDRDFKAVVENCARVRRHGQKGTWITREYIETYVKLHELGEAHSFEVRDKGELIGGIYGVDAGGVFCGESMFFLRPNASKLALLYLVDYLTGRGSDWLDVQVMTPHMRKFGAVEIPRDQFLKRLKEYQAKGLDLFPRSNLE